MKKGKVCNALLIAFHVTVWTFGVECNQEKCDITEQCNKDEFCEVTLKKCRPCRVLCPDEKPKKDCKTKCTDYYIKIYGTVDEGRNYSISTLVVSVVIGCLGSISITVVIVWIYVRFRKRNTDSSKKEKEISHKPLIGAVRSESGRSYDSGYHSIRKKKYTDETDIDNQKSSEIQQNETDIESQEFIIEVLDIQQNLNCPRQESSDSIDNEYLGRSDSIPIVNDVTRIRMQYFPGASIAVDHKQNAHIEVTSQSSDSGCCGIDCPQACSDLTESKYCDSPTSTIDQSRHELNHDAHIEVTSQSSDCGCCGIDCPQACSDLTETKYCHSPTSTMDQARHEPMSKIQEETKQIYNQCDLEEEFERIIQNLSFPRYANGYEINNVTGKIEINIDEGKAEQFKTFLQKNLEEFNGRGLIEIKESRWKLAEDIRKKLNEIKQSIHNQNTISPGTLIAFLPVEVGKHVIQCGDIRSLENVYTCAYEISLGTVGGFLRDKYYNIYIITSQHLVNDKIGVYSDSGFKEHHHACDDPEDCFKTHKVAILHKHEEASGRKQPTMVDGKKTGIFCEDHSYSTGKYKPQNDAGKTKPKNDVVKTKQENDFVKKKPENSAVNCKLENNDGKKKSEYDIGKNEPENGNELNMKYQIYDMAVIKFENPELINKYLQPHNFGDTFPDAKLEVNEPTLDVPVKKIGAKSGHTNGIIYDINCNWGVKDVNIPCIHSFAVESAMKKPFGKINKSKINAFALIGDSGSLVTSLNEAGQREVIGIVHKVDEFGKALCIGFKENLREVTKQMEKKHGIEEIQLLQPEDMEYVYKAYEPNINDKVSSSMEVRQVEQF